MSWGAIFFIGFWIGLILGCTIMNYAWKRDYYYNDKIYHDFNRKRTEARARRRAKYEEKLRKVQ